MKLVNSQTCHDTKTQLEADSSSLTKEWFDSREAAAYLCLPLGSLRNMTSNGQIPFYKLGSRNRYRISDLRNYLLAQKRGGSL